MPQTVTQEEVGVVVHDAAAKSRASVALSGTLTVGDHIRIKSPKGTQGPTTDFAQEITAIYVDGQSRRRASERTIQIVVTQDVYKKDVVYRILIAHGLPPAGPDKPPPPVPPPGGSATNGGRKQGKSKPTARPSSPSAKRDEKDEDDGEDAPSLPDPSEFPPPQRKKKGRGVGG